MIFKDLTKKMEQSRQQRRQESGRLEAIKQVDDAEDRGGIKPPPPDSGPDWRREMGELYGWPHKCGDSWGICVVPTKQQNKQIDERHHLACDANDYDADYLNGEIAVSIDSKGQERRLVITDSRDYGSRYDPDGNTLIVCRSRPRDVERGHARNTPTETPPVVRGAGRQAGGKPPSSNARADRDAPGTAGR